MNAALVKIDVAAVDLKHGVPSIQKMVDGGDLLLPGLVWVFNVARDLNSRDRELRFCRLELQGVSFNPPRNPYARHKLGEMIALILPEGINNFQAGQVDDLFQLRPRTRIDLHEEICGKLISGRNSYSRTVLASFLRRRWLGRVKATIKKGLVAA